MKLVATTRIGVWATCCLSLGNTFAQGTDATVPTASAPPPAAASAPPQTITVTGQREPEQGVVRRRSSGTALFGDADLRDVPFTVNIVGASEIKNKQATSIAKALSSDPAFSSSTGGDGASLLEAFGVRGFSFVSQLVDGFADGASGYTFGWTEVLEQIEILRGGAAFRFGFVSPGGVINFVTKRPKAEPFGNLTTSIDQYGGWGLHLDTGTRLGEARQFGLRINAIVFGGNTFIDDTERERRMFSLTTDWQLHRDVRLSVDLETMRFVSKGDGLGGFRGIPLDSSGNLPTRIPDPRRQWLNAPWGGTTWYTNRIRPRLTWQISPQWKLDTALYAENGEEALPRVAGASNWAPGGSFEASTGGGFAFPEQVRGLTSYLQGQIDTAGMRHHLTLGLTVARNRGRSFVYPNATGLVSGVPGSFENPAILPRPEPGERVFDSAFGSREQGVFISNRIDIGRWHPLIGLRWSEIDQPDQSPPYKDSATTPILGLTYDLSENISLFASYSAGIESGGSAPLEPSIINAGELLPPFRSKAYEFGLKSEFFGGALAVDGAVFSIDKASAFLNGEGFFVQSGRQVHRGFEVIVKGKVLPGLELNSGIQFLDAKLRGNPETAGNVPQNVPRWSLVLGGDYAWPGLPGLTLTAQANHTSSRQVTIPNTITVQGHTLLDVGVRYEGTLGQRKVIGRLSVDNVADRRYWSSVFDFVSEIGAPRTAKASLEVQF